MTLYYTEGVTAKVIMIDYIDEIIDALYKSDTRGRWINSIASPEDLYKVDEEYENLIPY